MQKNKLIKEKGPKGVSSQTQGEQVRVTSKKRDDLQAVMALLKGEDLGLPLQFENGESVGSLGLTGEEVFDIEGIAGEMTPGKRLTVRATAPDGSVTETFAAEPLATT